MIIFSCKNKQNMKNDYEIISEIILLECSDKKLNTNCRNQKYNIEKKYDSGEKFSLIQENKVFFKASETNKYFMYEIYKSRFLLISYIKTPNNLASPYNAERNEIYLFDLKNKKIYNFDSRGYLFSVFKNNNIKVNIINNNGLNRVTISDIDVEKEIITLELADLTKKSIKLNPIDKDIAIID